MTFILALVCFLIGLTVGIFGMTVATKADKENLFDAGFEAGKAEVTQFGEIIATYNGELMVSFPDGDMARYERINDE